MPGSSKAAGVEVMVGVEVGGRVEVLVALGRGEEKGLGVDVGGEEAVAEAAGDERIFVGLAEGRMSAVGVLGSQAVRSRVSPKSDTRMSR